MARKKIAAIVKLQIPAGKATAAPACRAGIGATQRQYYGVRAFI